VTIQPTVTKWIRPKYWYDLLTLDHTMCVFCFRTGAPRDVSLRTQAGYAIVSRPSRNGGRQWKLQSRAAFKAHVERLHPEMMENVAWPRRELSK
jgi:hypothetical protein